MSTDFIDLQRSLDSPLLSQLTEQQQLRLTNLLDEYLQRLETGDAPNIQHILSTNPDLAEAFQTYLSKLQAIYGLAAQQFEFKNNSDSLPFQKLGDFELIREIGRGGMGIVYEATQTSMGRRVALKLLSLSSAMDPRQIARFQNESRAAGLLQHPNIVPVYSVGSHNGIHFYAMQLIEGISVEQWIDDKESSETSTVSSSEPQWRTVVEWIAQIADGLDAAHETGIVHRDVKPSNLIIDKANRIWITDFGLARCTHDKSVTQSGDLIGTMRYMSPEQASGKAALVDGGSDIYGLAATLYEMLTLRPAIEGDEPAQILRNIDENNIKPLRWQASYLPKSLEIVISKALSRQRFSRYESARDFATDLRRVLNNQPTFAQAATAWERMGQWAARHQRTVVSSIVVLTLTVLSLLVSFTLISNEKNRTEAIAKRNAVNELLARNTIDDQTQMAELLEDYPAASNIRSQMLQHSLEYYQQYALNAQNSPDLQRTLATAFGKIGVLRGQLGDHVKALDALRESEREFAQLASHHPHDSETLLEWSVSLNNLGQALHRSGQFEEAVQSIQHAIELQTKLAKIEGDQNEYNIQLATSWSNLGLLYAEQVDLDSNPVHSTSEQDSAAEGAFKRAIDLVEALDADSRSLKSLLLICASRTHLSQLIRKSRPTEAIEQASQAFQDEMKALELAQNQYSPKLSSQTAHTLIALASAQADDPRQMGAARDRLLQAIQINEELVRWHSEPNYQSDLATSWSQLGFVLSRMDRLEDAREAFQKALQYQLKLVDEHSDDAEILSSTGSIYNNVGFLDKKRGDSQNAIAAFREAVRFQKMAVERAPQVSRYRENLQKHEANLRSIEERR